MALMPLSISRIVREMDTPLLPNDVRDRLAAFAEGLPDVFTWCVVEFRLAPDEPEVDLLLAITDHVVGGRAACATSLQSGPVQALSSSRNLLAAWCEGRGALDAVGSMWLEWDCPWRDPHPPIELIALTPALSSRRPAQRTPHAILAEATAAVGAPPLPADWFTHLDMVARALPVQGLLMYAASLRPRGVEALRLFVAMPREQVAEFLDRAGQPGDRAEQVAGTTRMVREHETTYLQLEVDSVGLRPYFAVEPPQVELLGGHVAARTRTLEDLAADGWVDAARSRALMAWCDGVQDADGILTTRTIHLKAVLRDQGPQVKGYLHEFVVTPDR